MTFHKSITIWCDNECTEFIESPDGETGVERGHKQRGECIERLGMYHRFYTLAEAKKYQKRKIAERRGIDMEDDE